MNGQFEANAVADVRTIAIAPTTYGAPIDARLASVGSSKEKILSAQIWLKDIDRDFAGLNAAWETWVPADAVPTRATCEAKLAAPELLVEIIVTAAL